MHRDKVTSEDILQSNLDLVHDQRSQSISFFIVDFLDGTEFSVTPEIIRKVASNDYELSQKNPHIKMAVIANRNIMKGFTRMYELSGAGNIWEIEIFEEREKAYNWLGIEMP